VASRARAAILAPAFAWESTREGHRIGGLPVLNNTGNPSVTPLQNRRRAGPVIRSVEVLGCVFRPDLGELGVAFFFFTYCLPLRSEHRSLRAITPEKSLIMDSNGDGQRPGGCACSCPCSVRSRS